MNNEILAALIGAVAALAAGFIPFLKEVRKRQDLKYKLAYVRVVHLRQREPGAEPVTRAYVKRLGRSIDVFDEYHLFKLNIFNSSRASFTCKDRTSGAVDLQILHPWQENLRFADKGAEQLEGYVEQAILEPSSVFLIKSIYYNALQPGYEDIAMRIDDNTEEARLVIDFSSLPQSEALLLDPPVGYLRAADGEERRLGVAQPYPGVYTINCPAVKQGQVIRMEFKIAWDRCVLPGRAETRVS